jgi:hypothetical protein
MAVALLGYVPTGTAVFIDANVFVCAFDGKSRDCQELLDRCAREELVGIPKLRGSGQDLSLDLDASLTIRSQDFAYVETELRQALRDLGLDGLVRIEKGGVVS